MGPELRAAAPGDAHDAQARAGAGRGACGPLHAAHFERKPRGALLGTTAPPDGYCVRFDWCCGECRRRTLPASVRFLGRKVYLAVANAIVDALAELGVEHIELPATPERVWRAIREARRVIMRRQGEAP